MQTKARRLSKQAGGRTGGRVSSAALAAERAWQQTPDGRRAEAEREHKRKGQARRRQRRFKRLGAID